MSNVKSETHVAGATGGATGGGSGGTGSTSSSTRSQSVQHYSITPHIQITMETFDPKNDQWQLYVERLENYLAAYSITSEAKRRNALLNCIGPTAYKIVRDMCSPDSPATKSYEELKLTLKNFYVPEIVVLMERKNFYNAVRKTGESATEWLARIKRLSIDCQFGQRLESTVLDKFMCSLEGKAFDRVSEEETSTITLQKALQLAVKYEKRAAKPESKPEAKPETVDYINDSTSKSKFRKKTTRKPFPRRSEPQKASSKKCSRCGRTNHSDDQCRFKNATCHNCKIAGHVIAVCPSKKDSVNLVNDSRNNNMIVSVDDSITDQLFSITSGDGATPIWANVMIDGKPMQFVIDSGSSVSIISKRIYDQNFASMELKESQAKLCSFTGHPIEICGYFSPNVQFNRLDRRLQVLVGNGERPSIFGRDFLRVFNLTFTQLDELGSVHRIEMVNESTIESDITLEGLLNKHEKLFNGELGRFSHRKIHLNLRNDAIPLYFKPRTVPYAFREQVDKELARLEQLGVITPTSTNDWGTPLVPVLKEDGSLRLCADYKITLNKGLVDDRHPLPRVEHIFNALEGGESFTKLDLEMAYNQLELDDESRKLAAWSTPKGVYIVNRLAFGIKTATGIFQNEMEKLLQGIEGVFVFVDDVVITGQTRQDHLKNLSTVLQRLEEAGLRLKKKKCQFFQPEIKYLGHIVSSEGIRKAEDRIDSVLKAQEPKCVSDVRAFAGMVNYYGRYFRNLADTMAPIYRLLKKDVPFEWNEDCRRSFEIIKKEIVNDVTLAHFNSKLPIILETDASDKGIGGILSHEMPDGTERPIAYFSRTLSKAEHNYPTIQKEALAIVESAKKFFDYLIGQKFKLRTDHKPLIAIFGEKRGIPSIAAARMQRWAYYLTAFDYTIEHQPGEDNQAADALSRLPQETSISQRDEGPTYIDFIDQKGVHFDCTAIKRETTKDKTLSKVFDAVRSGTLESLTSEEYKPYRLRSSELTTEAGILMWGYRVVIPQKLRSEAVSNIHSSHLGIVKSKSLARMCMWWPGMDADIERIIKACEHCAELRPDPPKAALVTWANAAKPWSRIHVDFAGPMEKEYFFIITDAFSKWPEVFRTKTITAEFTIRKLREVFARFGLPEVVVSDAGTQFTSEVFKKFLNNNNIRGIVIAPGHPASNGAAENSVKSFKKGLRASLACARASNLSTDLDVIVQRYLFDYRNAIHCSTGEKPSRVMFGRDLQTRFTLLSPKSVREKIDESRLKQEANFCGRREDTFAVGDRVMIRDYSNPNRASWSKAKVIEALGERNYVCELESGRVIKRHLDQMFSFEEIGELPSADTSTVVQPPTVSPERRVTRKMARELAN